MSRNINHFNIKCMFTLIWFACRVYDLGSNRMPDKYSVDPFCPLTNIPREKWRDCVVVCVHKCPCVCVCVCAHPRMSVGLHVFVIVRWISLFVVVTSNVWVRQKSVSDDHRKVLYQKSDPQCRWTGKAAVGLYVMQAIAWCVYSYSALFPACPS